jgi:hypothetical protein
MFRQHHRRAFATVVAIALGIGTQSVQTSASTPPARSSMAPNVEVTPEAIAAALGPSSDVAIGTRSDGRPASDRYIVEVDEPVAAVVDRQDLGIEVIHVWDDVTSGFAAELTRFDLGRLARDPAVIDIHADEIVTLSAVQPNAPWGLDRIDQLDPPVDGTYAYDSSGAGVTAYVVDTGIRSTHSEFAGRVGSGAFVDFGDGRGVEDCNGHGTHVAGILAGTVSGVAKAATIVPVKVFNCSGSAFTFDVIAGLNWIVGDHLPGEPAVVNMSLGSPTAFEPLDAAVRAVIADGITVVAAAGNSSVSSCGVSPARVLDAITVAAINSNDTRASYSNFGPCNDVFAPGTGIVSADIAGDRSFATRSGTSMAAPFVAGAVARFLQSVPGASPTTVRSAIDGSTDPGVLDQCCGDPDKILYLEPPPPPCSPSPAGIIGWWKGEGSVAAVVGPPLSGMATYAPNRVGTGFEFDGTSSLSASGLPALTSALTFEAWVRPFSDTVVQTIAARWDFPSTDDSARTFALTLQPGNRLVIETDETSTRRPEVLTATVPQLHDGRMHHVAATWDRTRLALFVDGSQIAASVSQGGTLNPAPATPLTIGGQTRGFGTNGLIDEPTIYSRAIGAGEIAAIHTAGRSGKCP